MKNLLRAIVVAMVERRFLAVLIANVDKVISRIMLHVMRLYYRPVPDTVLFTNMGGDYDCNPKYICEEILRRKLPYSLTWAVYGKATVKKHVPNDVSYGRYPPDVVLSSRYSFRFYTHLLRAKVIVDNSTTYAWYRVPKASGQFVINTWHGSLGIKRFPKSETSVGNARYNRMGRKLGALVDVVISNSTFEESYYRETYFPKNQILRLGHARNDVLFAVNSARAQEIRRKVESYFKIGPSTKVCLYAPTFRDGGNMRPYAIDYDRLFEALRERFGGEWVVLTRFHVRSRDFAGGIHYPPGVIAASDYSDMTELLVRADVGITDYSSWICEYIHTGRPGFLYATDIDHYGNVERGFYDPLDQMPFPLSTNSDELSASIKTFDAEKYARDCKAFIVKKGCMDDGHAAERIVDLIEEHMRS